MLAWLVLAAWLPAAHADWQGELRLLSDYNHRGYSKSRGDPVAQAKLDYQGGSGWYAGAVLSRVRFDDWLNDDRATLEFAPYVGISWPLAPDWRVEVSAAGYFYDGKVFDQAATYAEFAGSLHYSHWFSAKAIFTPDAYGTGADVAGAELNFRRDVIDTIQFSATAGYSGAKSLLDHDYGYWNAGFSWFLSPRLVLDARYTGMSVRRHPHHGGVVYQDEFYPRRRDGELLFSLTLGL